MKGGKTLVITGMHRSGTSAVASVLRRAGVWIGSRLVAANAGNPRGYFEDEDFVRFHDRQLARSGQRVLAQVGAELAPPRRQDVRLAEELIRQRRRHELWGWKDPRTSLYLDFWARRLPQARFLLVFRDPVEVVLSLLRRGSGHELEVMADPLVGLRCWRLYNQSILDFYQRQSERCFLVDVDQVFSDAEGFVGAAAEKLELPLRSDVANDLLHREEFHRRPASSEAAALLRRIDPQTVELLEELAETADWNATGISPPDSDPAIDESLRKMRETADSMAGSESVAGPIFTLMLALLDGRATKSVNPSAQVFDLLDRIASSHRHAENLQAGIDRGEERIRGLEEHTANVEKRAGELEAHSEGLESALTAALERQEALEVHAENLDARGRLDGRRIAELEIHAGNLESLRARDLEQMAGLEAHAGNLESLRARDLEQMAGLEAHAGNLESLRARDLEQMAGLEAHAGNLESLRARDLEQMAGLEAHAGNLESLRARDLERMAELDVHVGNLESLRRRNEDRLAALGAHVDNLEQARLQDGRRERDLEALASRLGAELARRRAWLEELDRERLRLDQELEDRDRQLQELATCRAELLERLARREAAVKGLEGEARRLGRELEEVTQALHELGSAPWTKLLRRFNLLP